MVSFFFWLAIGFAAGAVVSSFFEWVLHRYVMHKPFLSFRYPFEKHALVHHHIFKADESYHLIDAKDKKTIHMAWWNGPVLVMLVLLPFLVAALFLQKWALLCGAAISCTLYYAAYEYMHWCMHLPKNRHVERSSIFYRLNGHHILHHRYMHKNFNVVLPLADWSLGTLLLRSKIAFPQPRGPSVPDLQPKEKRQIPRLSNKLKQTAPNQNNLRNRL